MTVMTRQEIPRLILAIAICQLAGALGSVNRFKYMVHSLRATSGICRSNTGESDVAVYSQSNIWPKSDAIGDPRQRLNSSLGKPG